MQIEITQWFLLRYLGETPDAAQPCSGQPGSVYAQPKTQQREWEKNKIENLESPVQGTVAETETDWNNCALDSFC